MGHLYIQTARHRLQPWLKGTLSSHSIHLCHLHLQVNRKNRHTTQTQVCIDIDIDADTDTHSAFPSITATCTCNSLCSKWIVDIDTTQTQVYKNKDTDTDTYTYTSTDTNTNTNTHIDTGRETLQSCPRLACNLCDCTMQWNRIAKVLSHSDYIASATSIGWKSRALFTSTHDYQ